MSHGVRSMIVLALLGLAVAGITANAGALDPFDRASRLELAGDYTQALETYESCVAAQPDDPRAPLAAFAAASLRFLALDDLDAAAEAYARLIDRYPDSPWSAEAARRRGECFQARERWAEAGAAYGRALELSGGEAVDASPEWINEVSLVAADCYYKLGDRQRLIATYEQALGSSLPPHSTAALRFRLGDCYESGGEPRKAAEQYAQIIREQPCAPAFDQAMTRRELIEEYVSIDWAPVETYAQTRQDFRERDFAGALARCEQVLAATDNEALRTCARYRRILAGTVVAGDFTAGAAQLESLIGSLEDPRTMPGAPQQLAAIRRVAGLEAEAEASSEDTDVLGALGMAYFRAGAVARAVVVLERSRDLDPMDSATRRLLGTAYLSAGRPDEARAEFDRYLAENPNDTNALNMIGYTCLGQGDAESALTYFERYVAVAPEDANAHDSYGEGLVSAGRIAEAVTEYERAVELDRDFFNSWYVLGDLYQQQGRMAKSAEAYRRALELAPADARSAAARALLAEPESGSGQ